MARITIYKNSVLASLISILGYIFVIGGICVMFGGEIGGGIVMLIVGIALAMWASAISENKKFKTWKKELQAKGVEAQIRTSTQVAFQVYNAYPRSNTLNYIRSLNPAAAQLIADQIAANKGGKK